MKKLRWIDEADVNYTQEPVLRVSRRARRVLDLLNANLTGAADRVQYERICRGVRDLVTDRRAADILVSELQAIVGCVISPADRVRIACSLAGAVADARVESLGGLLMGDVPAKFALAVVKSVATEEDISGEKYYHWKLLICNSAYAGQELFADVLISSSVRWARQLGLLGSKFKPLRWHSGMQFLDSRLLVCVESQSNQLLLHGASVCPQVLTLNRKLSAGRSRLLSSCHLGATYDCALCAVGRNQCGRSMVTQDTEYDL